MFTRYALLRDFLSQLPGRDRGGTAAEYALIIGLIAAVIAGAVGALGQGALNLFNVPLGGF
jgi:Flp pilus assembly pilin Flp